ncbi:MAG: hypothetical protein QXZ11_00290 [Thermoproteota archaeon]
MNPLDFFNLHKLSPSDLALLMAQNAAGGAASAQPPVQQPPTQQPPAQQPPLPNSLDEFVPQTLPTPSVLPKYHGFSEEELALWEPLWLLSRGYTLPDDDFSRQLALMGYREQFRKEADLIAFDAYRKNLEIRAQHDQRVRQLFAPIAQDFNTVFSSEAIQQALREVIAAYKSTNPKISWNKLSPDAKRREILRFMQQGRLPTLKRFAEQWGRLKNSFQAYKTLLQPADQMVVAELDGILGGSFEDFILKYLTLNDPEEEEQQRQLQALRQQHLLYRQLMKEFPDIYQRPQLGGGTIGGASGLTPNFSLGGGSPQIGGGRGSGQPQSSPQGASIDFRKYGIDYVRAFKDPRTVDIFPDPTISGMYINTLFTGSQMSSPAETAEVIRRYTTVPLNRLTTILSKHQTVSSLMSGTKHLFSEVLRGLRRDVNSGTITPNTMELIRQYAAHTALSILIDVQRQYPINNMTPQQRDELMRVIHGSALESIMNNLPLSISNREVRVGNTQKRVNDAIADAISVGLGGQQGVSFNISTSRAIATGQNYEERINAVRNSLRSSLRTLRETVNAFNRVALEQSPLLAAPPNSLMAHFSAGQAQRLRQNAMEAHKRFGQHIDNTNERIAKISQERNPTELFIPLKELGVFGSPEEAAQAINRISEDALVQQIEEYLFRVFPQSRITSMMKQGDKLKVEIRLGTYKEGSRKGIAFYLFVAPSTPPKSPQQQRRGK